ALVLLVFSFGTAFGRLAVPLVFLEAVPDRFLDCAKGDGLGAVGETLDRLDAVLLEDPLHAADGVALAVKQPANPLEKIDIVRPVIAAAAAPLHRLDLRETRFPEPQHVLGNVQVVSDFADGAECIRRLVQMPDSLTSEC